MKYEWGCDRRHKQEDKSLKIHYFPPEAADNFSYFLHRNVHSRSAANVTIATMREQGACPAAFWCLHFHVCGTFTAFSSSLPGVSRALLHNFAGKSSVALEGVRAGYLFSFPPAVCRNQQVGCEQRNHMYRWYSSQAIKSFWSFDHKLNSVCHQHQDTLYGHVHLVAFMVTQLGISPQGTYCVLKLRLTSN